MAGLGAACRRRTPYPRPAASGSGLMRVVRAHMRMGERRHRHSLERAGVSVGGARRGRDGGAQHACAAPPTPALPRAETA